MSSYVESRRLTHVWYKVDEGDADLATFFYYLGIAARRAAPRKSRRLPLLTPERLPGISVFTRRYFEDLSSLLPRPSLLVFDDCHRISADSPLFDMLRDGISRLGPGIGAVLISRSAPPPCFSRERANRELEVLGWRDLRLDLREATGIVRLLRKASSAVPVRELLQRTDGWAAGLVLLLQRSDLLTLDARRIGEQVPAEIVEYFGNEIFRRLDDETRLFLMRSSFLPRMTRSMAERLSGAAHAGRILADLNRQNLFTEKSAQQEPVYEYHALFREYLVEQATCAFSTDALAELRRGAAALLEEAGCVEDAVPLLRQARDWEALARLIASRASDLIAQGRHRTVLDWIEALPADVRDREPSLAYWTAIGLAPFSPAQSRPLFEKAFAGFEARNEVRGVFRSWAGLVDSSLAALDDFSSLDPWIALLPVLLERNHGFPSDDIRDEVTTSFFTALLYCRPAGVDIDEWAGRTLAVLRNTRDATLKIKSGISFFLYQLGQGGFVDAERSVASMRELLDRPDVTPLRRLWVAWMESVVAVFVADPRRCVRVASDGLAFAKQVGIHVVDPLLVGYAALGALHLGDVETANGYLAAMTATLGSESPVIAALYHHVLACDALHRRDHRRAALHAETSLTQLEAGRNRTFVPIGHLLASHVHHAAGEDDDAAGHLVAARRVGAELKSPHASWLAALSEAFFRFERGEDASAIPVLGDGMRIGREHGLVGTFMWRPGFLETIAAKALEHGIEVEYACELIRRNHLRPGPADVDLREWPWTVKVCTLGPFELVVEGRPVQFGRKVQQRPLSLLKALIALGGREVPVSRLEELLWPEAEGDLAHLSLTSALNRLRKLVGHDALVLREGRLSLSTEHCWVDVWAFARLVARATDARKARRDDDAIRLLSRALDVYRGAFLPVDEAAWAVSARERLRSSHVAAVTQLATCHEAKMRWDEAAACYAKALEADELAEELYRRLMICHVRQGRTAEALSVYERCQKALSFAPSPETRTIATALVTARA